MMKDIRKYYYSWPLLLALLLILCLAPEMDASAAKVYYSVEKFTIGQGYLVEPTEVTITDGETLTAVTKRALQNAGYTIAARVDGTYGWYLEGIKDADKGNSKVPQCIQNMDENAPKTGDLNPAEEKNVDAFGDPLYPGLYEFSYTPYAGWLFFVNNKGISVGADNIRLHDEDVVRLRFSIYGTGADLGESWAGSPALTLPNLDALTKRLAVYRTNKEACDAKGYASAYKTARDTAANMDSTSDQVDAAYEKLPTEAAMRQWTKDLAAAKKAAEEKARIKKYTPAKVKLVSVKKIKAQTVKITWKKSKTATGYQVWMSNKKAKGYKKIKSLKGKKKVSFKKAKLKKKKTYYFKVRPYRKAGGRTYYGPYSNIKKIRLK